jgi:hypothetical protein
MWKREHGGEDRNNIPAWNQTSAISSKEITMLSQLRRPEDLLQFVEVTPKMEAEYSSEILVST